MKKAILLLVALLAGCGTPPPTIVQKPTTTRGPSHAGVPAQNGAIFQASAYRPMFEDHRARLVGDILTIAISENTSATKSNGTSGSKSGATSFNTGGLFAVPATTTAKLNLDTSTANTFSEKGAANSSNTFSGTIGVTVIDVMPNGNLVVSGEKQIAFDKGAEFVRFSGVVNPDTISNNTVPSTQVADVRVEYRTNSRIDRSEMMSQMARFFLSILPI